MEPGESESKVRKVKYKMQMMTKDYMNDKERKYDVQTVGKVTRKKRKEGSQEKDSSTEERKKEGAAEEKDKRKEMNCINKHETLNKKWNRKKVRPKQLERRKRGKTVKNVNERYGERQKCGRT